MEPSTASSAAPSTAASGGQKRKAESDRPPMQELHNSSSSSAPAAEQSKAAKRAKAKKPRKHRLSKEEIAELLEKREFFQGDWDEPVYDDCNEVRRKITAFLRTGRMTQTAFLKALGINSNSHRNFMRYTGRRQGSGNGLYPAAYSFFESLRILEGRPKTAKRRGAEGIFGDDGRSLDRAPTSYLVPVDAVLVEDEWGRVGVQSCHPTLQPAQYFAGQPAVQAVAEAATDATASTASD